MEWGVIVSFALLAVALVALPGVRGPRGRDHAAEAAAELEALAEERRRLLDELRELDDDAAAGRISGEDRLAGRRALAPRLRAVTEALRARGVEPGVQQ